MSMPKCPYCFRYSDTVAEGWCDQCGKSVATGAPPKATKPRREIKPRSRVKVRVPYQTALAGSWPRLCIMCGKETQDVKRYRLASRVGNWVEYMKAETPIPMCRRHQRIMVLHWLLILPFVIALMVAFGLGTFLSLEWLPKGYGLWCFAFGFIAMAVTGGVLGTPLSNLSFRVAFEPEGVILINVSAKFARACRGGQIL